MIRRQTVALTAIFVAVTCAMSMKGELCTASVVDPNHVLTASQLKTIAERTFNSLRGKVHILIAPRGTKSIDEYEQAIAQACWDKENTGRLKDDVLILAVAPEIHQVGVYYGSQYKPGLDTKRNHAIGVLNRHAEAKDYAGGFMTAEIELMTNGVEVGFR